MMDLVWDATKNREDLYYTVIVAIGVLILWIWDKK